MTATLEIAAIPLRAIAPDPAQPRHAFDDAALSELAASIRDLGVIQPIVVRPFTEVVGEQIDLDGPQYRLIAGERRWRAAQLAGLAEIPALIRSDLSDADISVLQIVENLQRADLSLPELAAGCGKLIAYFRAQIEAGELPADASALSLAAERLGKSNSWVSKRAGIARLNPAVRELVDDGVIVDVEIAHGIHQVFEYHTGIAEDLIERATRPERFGGALTRAFIAERLAEVKKQAAAADQRQAQAALAAAEQRRAQVADAPPADGALFTPIDGPEADPQTPAPAITETATEREIRLRAEAWAELAPACRQYAQERRKEIIDCLHEVSANAGAFALSIDLPEHYAAGDAPGSVGAADYVVRVAGLSQDAGELIAELKKDHLFTLNLKVTLPDLRRIEQALGELMIIEESLTIKGRALLGLPAKIKQSNTSPAQPATKTGGTAGIAEFLRACTRREPNSRVKSLDLYLAYTRWCESQQIKPVPATSNQWGTAIADAGIQKIRSNGWRYLDLAIEATP